MASNKRELAEEIEQMLQASGEVKNLQEAAQARTRLAQNLATKIDAYVQYQIGLRLEGILTAIGTPSGDTNVVPLVRGAGFDALTRKK